MKNTIAIVVVFFIIVHKTSQGLTLRLNRRCILASYPNPLGSPENRTFLAIEDKWNRGGRKGTIYRDPAVIKKGHQCGCGLPKCKCKYNQIPEQWYVKTIGQPDASTAPAMYKIKYYNSTAEFVNCLKQLENVKEFIRNKERSEKKLITKLCPINKKQHTENKLLYGCPPQIIFGRKKSEESLQRKKKFSFQCDCKRCRLGTRKDKAGVIMNCIQCGPINSNINNKNINFSKLLFERKNKIKINVKFLQDDFTKNGR